MTERGKKRGRGRPPKADVDRLSERLHLRFSPDEIALIDAARGATPRGTWVREIVMSHLNRGTED